MMLPRLAIGAAAGALAAALLAGPTSDALSELAIARAARAALTAEVATPAARPIAAEGQQVRAASAEDAERQIAARVRMLAARGGVLVEGVEDGGGTGLARLRVHVSGSEGAVLELAAAIERGPALVRFRSWQIEPTGDGVRLNGELIAPWG
jgi:hypothetical protein